MAVSVSPYYRCDEVRRRPRGQGIRSQQCRRSGLPCPLESKSSELSWCWLFALGWTTPRSTFPFPRASSRRFTPRKFDSPGICVRVQNHRHGDLREPVSGKRRGRVGHGPEHWAEASDPAFWSVRLNSVRRQTRRVEKGRGRIQGPDIQGQ